VGLIKISIDKITKNWELISGQLIKFLPPTVLGSQEQVEYTYSALLQEKMQMWVFVKDNKNYGVVITQFTGEPGTEIRNLLIYALVGFKPLTEDVLIEGWQTLTSFAKETTCHKIIAYTNIPAVVKMAEKVGAKAEYVLITKEITNE